MKLRPLFILAMSTVLALSACKDDDQPEPSAAKIQFDFAFDSTQVRLDNFGQPTGIGQGNAAQHPDFKRMAAHFIELVPTPSTGVGEGAVIYMSPETDAGGEKAIDFRELALVGESEVFFELPLKDIQPGTYKYIRVSLAYQNFSVRARVGSIDTDVELASFIGYNNYIDTARVGENSLPVMDDKLQGYFVINSAAGLSAGQAPQTTVPNPLNATAPIPAGSCIVTGEFAGDGLVIPAEPTDDLRVTLSISTNNSFEWQDDNQNGAYDPLDNEQVVDMGVRGLVPAIN